MKTRVYVGTTEGPVAIERITRESAPNSAMCIGRSTREATASTGYEAFVKQPSGVIEREFGPFSPGAFRLDVSADIGDGDSWQLGVFVAHALAVEGRLAEYHENADAALWLTGEVANDLEVKPVGHVPDKLRASRAEFEALAAAGTPLTLIVPNANRPYLEQAQLPPAATAIEVSRTAEALRAAGLSQPGTEPVEVEPEVATDAPETPADASARSGRRRWAYAAVGVLILAAGATAYPHAQRLWDPGASEKHPETPPPTAKVELSNTQTAPTTPGPATRPSSGAQADSAAPPATDARAAADSSEPKPDRADIGTTNSPEDGAPIAVTPPAESAQAPEPNSAQGADANPDTNSPQQSVAAVQAESPRPDIRLVIRERRAPPGSSCAAVHFGSVAAATTDVERAAPDRFAPSRHNQLCGLEFSIINDGAPAHVAAFTAIDTGRFIDAGRAPESLGGGIPFAGTATWNVDLARRLRGPIDYRLVAIVSEHPVADIAKRLRRLKDPVAAGLALSGEAVRVHHARHRVEP